MLGRPCIWSRPSLFRGGQGLPLCRLQGHVASSDSPRKHGGRQLSATAGVVQGILRFCLSKHQDSVAFRQLGFLVLWGTARAAVSKRGLVSACLKDFSMEIVETWLIQVLMEGRLASARIASVGVDIT